MKYRNYYCLLFTSFFFSGCITELTTDLPTTDLDVLVIDGNIIGNTTAIFNLSKSFLLNESETPESSKDVRAELTIIGSDGYQSDPATYLGQGVYEVKIKELNDNTSYHIQIKYNNDIYLSEPSKPISTPEIDSISWKQPGEWGNVSFHISTTNNNETSPSHFLWTYVEDWETKARVYTSYFYNPETGSFYSGGGPGPLYYCWKKNTKNSILIGTTGSLSENKIINKQLYEHEAASSDRFYVLYCTTITQRAISKRAYEYYQTKLKLNEEMGGLFTPQPSELKGNISCSTNPEKKTIGYVEVIKNTTQKRIFIGPADISKPSRGNNCDLIPRAEMEMKMAENGWTYTDIYNRGYRPVDMDRDPPMDPIPDQWTTMYCTECTRDGGTKDIPPFWPKK